jgi:hypothetical protein
MTEEFLNVKWLLQEGLNRLRATIRHATRNILLTTAQPAVNVVGALLAVHYGSVS